MRTIFSLILLLAIVPHVVSGAEEPVVLKTTGGSLHGTLTVPDKQAKGKPVVLIIAGSGPTDRNGNQPNLTNNAYKMLAESLEKEGIASLRFDKRGIGESGSSGLKESDLRFETYVEDVKQWIALLSDDKRFGKVIVAGHSEGSTIGMLAAIGNEKVKGYVSIAGPARPADEMIKEQLTAQAQEIRDIVYPMLDTLKGGDTLTNVPQMLYSLFRPGVQPYMISWFRYDPRVEIRKLKVPALIVQGSTDIQVLEKDADMLAAAYPKATKKIIQAMNHVLKDCVTTDKAAQVPIYSNPDLPINKELVTTMVDFIRRI